MAGFRVDLQEVTRRFPAGDGTITALDGVSLTLEPGTVLGPPGPSGSGKSTLLHVLGAMDVADEGRIEVDRFVVTDLDRRGQVEYRRGIGLGFPSLPLP